jgi:chromosome segregation ATPase
MTWTDDKEAEHQRIRADFAEAEVERLQGLYDDAKEALTEEYGVAESLRAEVEKLRANVRDAKDGWESMTRDRDHYADEAKRLRADATATEEHFLAKDAAQRAEVERLRAALEKIAVYIRGSEWIGEEAVKLKVIARNALAEEVTPIQTDP